MDVAGGSGGLAFELSVRRQIPCVVVDPRALRLTSSQRFVLEHRCKICDAVAPWTSVSPMALSTLRKFKAQRVCQLQALFDSDVILRGGDDPSDLASAVRDCSVLVGLHPDQALEHIIDTAVALRKPFVVA